MPDSQLEVDQEVLPVSHSFLSPDPQPPARVDSRRNVFRSQAREEREQVSHLGTV